MIALTAALLMATDATDERATILYVECVSSESERLAPSGGPRSSIVEAAIGNCESLIDGAAQASVDGAPSEVIKAYRAKGMTPEMILEIGKRISRDSAREVALHVLNKMENGKSPDAQD